MTTPVLVTIGNGFDRAAIMTAAWGKVREQIAFHAKLVEILPAPSIGKLLSNALKSIWKIARAQRARAIETVRKASPVYRAQIAAQDAKRAAGYRAAEARTVAATAAFFAKETEVQRIARLASLAATIAAESIGNTWG